MRSYSQAKQEDWVIDFFERKRNGYFLDIGALDGIQSSNTYILEKELGWKGLCVEPHPTHLPMLRTVRKNLVEKAIFSRNTRINMDWATSSIGIHPGTIPVEAITFQKLLEDYDVPNIIDYTSLDIEGAEYEALKTYPFDNYISILWTIEHNYYIHKDPTLKNQIKDIMLSNNYVLSREDVSCPDSQNLPFEDWYVHKDYIKS
jgi:FkbM family methyltransferase